MSGHSPGKCVTSDDVTFDACHPDKRPEDLCGRAGQVHRVSTKVYPVILYNYTRTL